MMQYNCLCKLEQTYSCHAGKGSLIQQRMQCSILRESFLANPVVQVDLAELWISNPPLTSLRGGEDLAFHTGVIERRRWRLEPTCLACHQVSSLCECKEGDLIIASRVMSPFKSIHRQR